ncbi:XdhC family protein [Grimontia marina]|uniref:Putative xanthine dehydrogenase subunit A n=1 Tax=Grimontia marina TaxID=646534 RepID=A0A128EZS7_9GAMM|nr:XdhC family protein [Grimontia marina]CZF80058.1 putative xanthine dehydrogenase subunit A [Grimontia marina]
MTDKIEMKIALMQKERSVFAVATVVDHWGSVSAKSGSKALINANGELVTGWIGGGCAESETCYQAKEAIKEGTPRTFDIDLDDEMLGVGMPCGGAMKVYVEPYVPAPKLWLIGHGKVVQTLCTLGSLMGLEVVINDTIATHASYPEATIIINDDTDYSQLEPAPEDYVVIATQHKGDHLSMMKAISSGAHYIALVASKKRAGLVMNYLDDQALRTPNVLVSTPAGLDIAAHTPEEIALSVMAEIVMFRRGGTGGRISQLAQKTGQRLDVRFAEGT